LLSSFVANQFHSLPQGERGYLFSPLPLRERDDFQSNEMRLENKGEGEDLPTPKIANKF
jgi:hypothetical protein